MPVPDNHWESHMTETSRRTLLRAGVLGLVAAPVAAAGSAFGADTSLSRYRRSRFTPLLGSPFRLVDATGSWRVRLTDIDDLPHAAPGDEDRFSITLSSATGGPPQGTYTLRRSRFTPTRLFVVPSDARRRTYEVVINRL